jgi:hypothetical protein
MLFKSRIVFLPQKAQKDKGKKQFSWGTALLRNFKLLLHRATLYTKESARLDMISDLQGVLKDHTNLNFWSKLALIFISGKSVYQHEISSKNLKNEKNYSYIFFNYNTIQQ